MKRTLAAIAAAAAMTAIIAPTASASSPNALTAVATCDGFDEPIETTVRNANAAFFNDKRQAPVGVTATASGNDGPRVGVVFGDVVEGVERTLRGQKPYDERGFDTTRCDIEVYDFPFGDVIIPVLPFFDVQVKLAPSR